MKELWDKLEDIYYVTDEVDKGVKSVLSDWYREQGDDDFLAHWPDNMDYRYIKEDLFQDYKTMWPTHHHS